MKSKAASNQLLFVGLLFVFGCNSEETKTTDDHKDTTAKATEAKSESARPAHWAYEGHDGPEHWGELSPAYALCAQGKNQSPINIEKLHVSTGATWSLNYKNTSLHISHNEHMNDIIDNGHTIQANIDPGSNFTFENKTYELKQFHFHTPSEHTIDGKHLPMEVHLVHQAKDGTLAVVAVLFTEGKKQNENLQKIIAHLPAAKGQTTQNRTDSIDINIAIPKDNHVYHYIGSLTTPPCSEDVQWLVIRQTLSATADQIKAISSRIGSNNRPTQALNGREVKLDDLKAKVK